MPAASKPDNCTIVICNRLDRVRQTLDKVGEPVYWLDFANTPESKSVVRYLRSTNIAIELDTADLLRKRREEFRRRYVDFIGHLNQRNASLGWWGLAPTTKNPTMTNLCWDMAAFLLIVDLVREGYKNLLVVVDSRHLAAQVEDWARQQSITSVSLFRRSGTLRRLLKLYTPVPVVKAFVIAIYAWLWVSKYSPQKKGAGHVVVTSLIYPSSFQDEESGGYRDVYFGPLIEYLEHSEREAVIVGLIRGPFRSQAAQLKKLRTRIPVVPLEAFLTLSDYLWCSVYALWRSATGNRLKGELQIGDVDVSTLVRETFREEIRSGDLFVCLRFYRAAFRLAERLNVDRFIYPYENRVWEKMLLLGLRKAAPQARLIGYQHTAITSGHLHFLLGEGEPEATPLPDVLLTTGEFVKDWLEIEGGYPPATIRTACALRHKAPLLTEVNSKGKYKSGNILVALGHHLYEDYASVLSQLGSALAIAGRRCLVIRPHPTNPVSRQKALEAMKLSGDNSYTMSSGSLSEEIDKANAVVYVSSTVGLEAAYAGVPTICVDQGRALDTDTTLGWDRFKWRAESPQSLADALHQIDDLSQDKFEALSKEAREYASSYLSPVTDEGIRCFLEA